MLEDVLLKDYSLLVEKNVFEFVKSSLLKKLELQFGTP